MEDEKSFEEFCNNIQKIIKSSEGIYKLAVQEYTPLVDTIIESKSKDSGRIEKLLDDLLSCACDEQILILFKRLCRYYYFINHEAVIFYVNAYRKMWDDDEEYQSDKGD